MIKITEKLRCKLTSEQLMEVAEDMNDTLGQIMQIEADAKRVAGEYKAKIDGQKALLVEHRNQFSSGHALRDVECEVRMDAPAKGKKQIVRLDTNEVIRTENMSHDEKNPPLPFPEPKPGEPLGSVGQAIAEAKSEAKPAEDATE